MTDRKPLIEVFEQFEDLELDTADYEVRPVSTALRGEHEQERLYHVQVKLGESRLPEQENEYLEVKLGYDSNEDGETLEISFSPTDNSSDRNLATIPFRQFLEPEYQADLTNYGHRPEEFRDIVVGTEPGEWFSQIPGLVEEKGLSYKEYADGVKIEDDSDTYIVEFRGDRNQVNVSKMIDDGKLMNNREELGSAANISELERHLEEEL